MTHREALELIRDGVPAEGAVWADLGAGRGTFTRALGELLGGDGTVWAVDRSEEAVRALRRVELPGGADLRVLHGDFTSSLEELGLPRLDGMLLANALHFVEDQEAVLERLRDRLRSGGHLLLVEYDRRRANRWVPHPVPPDGFRALALAAGLSEPWEVGRRRSAYWREMYAAVARWEGASSPRRGFRHGPSFPTL